VAFVWRSHCKHHLASRMTSTWPAGPVVPGGCSLDPVESGAGPLNRLCAAPLQAPGISLTCACTDPGCACTPQSQYSWPSQAPAALPAAVQSKLPGQTTNGKAVTVTVDSNGTALACASACSPTTAGYWAAAWSRVG